MNIKKIGSVSVSWLLVLSVFLQFAVLPLVQAEATVVQTGALKVNKLAVAGGGNGTFNMTGSGGIGDFSVVAVGGVGSYTIENLAPGSYSITENLTESDTWMQTGNTCNNVVVVPGFTSECAVINIYDACPQDPGIQAPDTSCTPVEPEEAPVCKAYSDENTKVVEIKIGANPASLTNITAAPISVVPTIQLLNPGIAWQANVGNPLAKWIWSEDPYDADSQTDKWVTFEKTFSLADVPTLASLSVGADNSYEIWVNKPASGAPDFADANEDNHSLADTHDITSLVLPGANTVYLKVKNWGANSSQANNPAGLIFNIDIQSPECPNGGSGNSGEPEKLQVKIYKYLDGAEANSESADGYEFPMHATWSWPSSPALIGSNGSGEYVLGLVGHGGSDPYQAFTSIMNAPATYSTYEITSDLDDSSLVLAAGATCEEGKFRLKGYRTGDSLQAALAAELSTESPDFTSPTLSANKYVIVDNETCPPAPDHEDENNENEGEDNPAPTVAPSDTNNGSGGGGGSSGLGGRRHDISSLLSSGGNGGEVLGASTEGPSCEPYLTKYIKFGADNDTEEVKKLQIFLNQFFELDNPVTGFYGPLTYDMVKKFQAHQEAGTLAPWSAAGLPTGGPTGYVYKTTLRWINILKCPEMINFTPIPPLP